MNFLRASISIKELNIDMLIKIHRSEEDETYSLFFQLETTNSLSGFLMITDNIITINTLFIVMFIFSKHCT